MVSKAIDHLFHSQSCKFISYASNRQNETRYMHTSSNWQKNNINLLSHSQTGPILFNPYLPHPSMLGGAPRMDGIPHEHYPLYCNQPYTAMTATPPRHLQYTTPLPQFPSPATAPPLSLPSTTHPIYYNMSHVQGGSFPVSRCSPTEASTVCPASPYSVVSDMHVHVYTNYHMTMCAYLMHTMCTYCTIKVLNSAAQCQDYTMYDTSCVY